MDKKLVYCIWLGVLYAEILTIFTLAFGVDVSAFTALSQDPVWWWIPTTVPQLVAVPFYLIAILVLVGILKIEDDERKDGVNP